jgi:hypothetical protein
VAVSTARRAEDEEDRLGPARRGEERVETDVQGNAAGSEREDDPDGRRQRRATRAARWAARFCFGLGALVLIGLAEFVALWLLAG